MPKTHISRAGSIRTVVPTQLVPKNHRQIDEESVRTLVQSLKFGNTFRNACAIAEIDYDLARRWMALGGYPLSGNDTKDSVVLADAEEPYKTFAQTAMTAIATAESTAVQNIQAAGIKDWRAALAWLERRNPDEWAVKKEAHQTVIASGGIQIILPDNGRDRPETLEAEGTVIRELPAD